MPGTDVTNRLSRALERAVVSGGSTLVALRRRFAGLVPEDNLKPLVVNVVDPELLEEVLGPTAAAPWLRLLRGQYERFRRAYPADWADVQAAWRQQRLRWRPGSPRSLARDYPEHDPAAPPVPGTPGPVSRARPARRPEARRRTEPSSAGLSSPPPASDVPLPLAGDSVPDIGSDDAATAGGSDPGGPARGVVKRVLAPAGPLAPAQEPSKAGSSVNAGATLSGPAPGGSPPPHIVERLLAAILSGDWSAVEAVRALWVDGNADGIVYAWVSGPLPPPVSDRLRQAAPVRALSAGR